MIRKLLFAAAVLPLGGCVSLSYHQQELRAVRRVLDVCYEKLDVERRTVDDLKALRLRDNDKKKEPEIKIEWEQ